MKNVTVTMEGSVAESARLEAAGRNTSVSRLVGELLAEKRAEVRRYQQWRPWAIDHATIATAWLLTEELQHDRRIDDLCVVNPFLAGPELLDAPA